jgi:chaperone modulatory protein CbpM
METEEMVLADEFCLHHKIEISFITSLKESGLIETIVKEEKVFVPVSQLHQLEKMMRMHYEMNINIEGVETITFLLERMHTMQRQIMQLTNRLLIYEAK